MTELHKGCDWWIATNWKDIRYWDWNFEDITTHDYMAQVNGVNMCLTKSIQFKWYAWSRNSKNIKGITYQLEIDGHKILESSKDGDNHGLDILYNSLVEQRKIQKELKKKLTIDKACGNSH